MFHVRPNIRRPAAPIDRAWLVLRAAADRVGLWLFALLLAFLTVAAGMVLLGWAVVETVRLVGA